MRINTVVRRSSHTLKIGCHANRHGCPLAEADSRQGRRDASASGACSPCLRLRLVSADVHPCLFWLCTVLSSSYVRHAAAVQELKVCTCHNPSPFLRMTVDILCPGRVPTPLPCCCALVPTPPDPRRTHEAHTPMRARQADSRCKCVLPAILHAYVQKRRSQSVCTTIYEPWKGSRSSTKTRAETAVSRHFALENAFIE